MQQLDNYERYRDAAEFAGVVAFETIRDDSVRERIEELDLRLDMVIIDEAHHMRNPTTLTHKVGQALSGCTDAMLLLSATPVNIHEADLFHLLNILDEGDFPSMQTLQDFLEPAGLLNESIRLLPAQPDGPQQALQSLQQLGNTPIGKAIAQQPAYSQITQRLEASGSFTPAELVETRRNLSQLNPLSRYINRTKKSEVEAYVVREPHIINVDMTRDEIALYEAMLEYIRAGYSANREQTPPGFVMVTRERQIASCLLAAYEILVQQRDADLGYEGVDTELDDEPPSGIYSSGGRSVFVIRREIEELVSTIGAEDSKLAQFRESLRRIHEEDPNAKILVFSTFKATLQYLDRRLRQGAPWLGGRIFQLDGDVAVENRPQLIQEFRDTEQFAVMLMSEVGAEGLDFQFTHILFNYDLPWNPMRVEQRIGRIDRYGQTQPKVQVYSFMLADTVEERILARLYERVGVFERSIGELEPILGDLVRDIHQFLFTGQLSPEQERMKAEQLERALQDKILRQQELDDLEQQLVGQDILLGRERDERLVSGRYLSEGELRMILEAGLRAGQYNAQLEDKGDGLFFLRSHPTLRTAVDHFCNNYPREVRAPLLSALGTSGVPISFRGDVRDERGLVQLVNFDHPLIRFAVDRINAHASDSQYIGLATLDSTGWPPGEYPFFIYGIQIESAQTRVELVPIVLERESGRHLEDLSDRLLAALPETGEWEGAYPPGQLERWETLETFADEAMSWRRDAIESEELGRNDQLIDIKVASLQRTHDVRRRRLQEQHDEATDPRIQRMRAGQIANLDADHNRRVADLEAQRAVTVSYNLLVQGWITAHPNGNH